MSQKQVTYALKIGSLVIKFLRDELTPAERLELESWLKEDGKNKSLLRKAFDEKLNRESIKLAEELNPDQAFNRLIANIRQHEQYKTGTVKRFPSFYKLAAAAIVAGIIGTAGWMMYRDTKDTVEPAQAAAVKRNADDIILTLADGSIINLEQQAQGVIATQGRSIVSKQANGQLSYTVTSGPDSNKEVGVNRLSIPRGKQYQLTLPDGSKVWLNAQTTLIFPGSFKTDERVVELSGEAYFEVARLSGSPFKVKTTEQTVEVLGTSFNISAYPEDKETVTTLATGSVKVLDKTGARLLTPGQAALKRNGSAGFDIAVADIEETLGWKNGVLVLKEATTEELMQTIARMYDIEVDIDPRVKDRRFGGTYPIRNGLPNLLRNLEQTKVVHFKTEGRRISVMP